MSIETRIADHIKKFGINLSAISRGTSISYDALYASLFDEERKRELRSRELMKVCDFLGKSPKDFWEE